MNEIPFAYSLTTLFKFTLAYEYSLFGKRLSLQDLSFVISCGRSSWKGMPTLKWLAEINFNFGGVQVLLVLESRKYIYKPRSVSQIHAFPSEVMCFTSA